MILTHQNRINIGIVAFTLASTFFMLYSAVSLPLRLNSFRNDPLQRYIKRFVLLKQSLFSSSPLGYISNSSDKPDLSQPDALAEFYLTQYALAPLLISDTLKPKFIVGNFHKNPAKQLQSHNLIIVKDFGNGVMLLRHNK